MIAATTLRRLAWAALAGTLVLAMGGSVVTVVVLDDPSLILFAVIVSFFAALGRVVLNRMPDHAVGWWMMGLGVSAAFGLLAQPYAGTGGLGSDWVALISSAVADTTSPLCLGMIVLFFPTGRLPFGRWLFWLIVGVAALNVAMNLFVPGAIADYGPVNPLGIGHADVLDPLREPLWNIFLTLAFIPATGSLLWRLWRSSGIERAQIKWVAYATVMLMLALVGSDLIGSLFSSEATATVISDGAFLIGFLSLPVAMAAAVLRYRLFDIDRIISRTLSYTLVTATLVAVFVAVVFGLRLLLPTENTLAVAASTLVVAALFNPVRRRAQDAVDRRFNRVRFDSVNVVESFGKRVRSEAGMDELVDDLISAAASSMEPRSLSLWLRDEEAT